nr:hypothetical protein [Escherichia coli]
MKYDGDGRETARFFSDKGCRRAPLFTAPADAARHKRCLWSVCLTEDVPDVRQELLNRLLSGKKLTGRDEQDIRRLWQETQRKHYA